MITDPIADFLTRIRNALKAGHRTLSVPHSKMKFEIAKVLKEKGYIQDVRLREGSPWGSLILNLRYDARTRQPAIAMIKRISTPGLRKYTRVENLPVVYNGLGIAILSTSMGVISDKEARKERVGGEVLCHIF